MDDATFQSICSNLWKISGPSPYRDFWTWEYAQGVEIVSADVERIKAKALALPGAFSPFQYRA